MKRLAYLIVFVLPFTFYFLSCKESSDNPYTSSKEIKLRYASEIFLNEELLAPQNICVVDSIIIIQEEKENGHFHAYNLFTGEKYVDFGLQGNGPEDLNWPTQIGINKTKDMLTVFDQGSKKLHFYPLNTIRNRNTPSPVQSIKMPSQASRVVQKNDSLFYFIGTLAKGMYGKWINNKVTDTYLNYPLLKNKDLSSEENHILFQGHLVMKPDNSSFVYASSRCDLLEIISTENSELQKIRSIYSYIPFYKRNSYKDDIDISIEKNSPNGFNSISVTDDYIYALYSGRTVTGDKNKSYFANTVYKIDWEGNLIEKIILDKDAWLLHVDKASNKLYTINYEIKDVETTIRYLVYNL